jgi:hypothetical protein
MGGAGREDGMIGVCQACVVVLALCGALWIGERVGDLWQWMKGDRR